VFAAFEHDFMHVAFFAFERAHFRIEMEHHAVTLMQLPEHGAHALAELFGERDLLR
jgi:hypothetical protein